jgi:hypothetical protein
MFVYDIQSCVRGDDFSKTFRFKNKTTGLPTDLSGTVWVAQVWSITRQLAATMSVDTSQATSGIITIRFNESETASLLRSSYRWSLKSMKDGETHTRIKGRFGVVDGSFVSEGGNEP